MKKLSSVTISGGLTVDQATTLSGVVSVGGIGTGAYTSVLVRNSSNQMIYRNFSDFVNDVSGSLNLSGYVPTSRTITINGTTYDLSADRTWTITTPYVSKLQHTVKAGVAINKGQAVYVTGADGTNMIVGLASNASEATSSKTMGLLDATVSTNGFANVVTEGLLAGLDTSTAGTEGDPVWLGTGGNLIYGLTNKPYAPAHLVFIGIVTRKNANNGEIFVKVQNGFELNEIHDVDLKTNLPTAGQLLRYNSDGLWKNWSPNYLTAESDTLATVTGRGATTSTPVTFNGNVTLGNSADLVFQDLAGTFPTSGKGFDWTLNNDGARIYAIQPNSDSIDLVFQLRDNATTNDRFVFWVDEWQGPAYDKYPLIISGGTEFDLKDSSLFTNSVLRLSNSGVLQNVTGNISMFTNNVGYLTSYTETDTLASVTARGATTSQNITINGQLVLNNGVGPGSGQALIVGGSGDVTLSDGGSLFFGAYDYGGSTYIRGYDNSNVLYFYVNGSNIAYLQNDRLYLAGTIFTSSHGNSSQWNTAYGWGNHASAGYLTSVTAHTQAWSTITSTPTTISGYGITNAYTDAQIQNFFNGANAITGYNKSNWDTAYGWGNHASAGYLTSVSDIWVNTAGDTMTGSLLFANNADNVRLQKGGSFLNLRDPWDNIHFSNNGGGIYVDSPIHYWRSASGSTYWMTLVSNCLGIGTTNPVTKLHAVGTSTTELRLQNADANNNYGFVKYETSVAGVGGNLVIGTNASGGGYGAIGFSNNNNVEFTGNGDIYLVKGGNVGIGTYSPGAKLHVVGNTYIQSGVLFVDTIAGYATNLVSLAASTNVLVPSGDITIGSAASTSSSQPFGDFSQLKFDNLHSDTNRGPNKIVMHNNGGTWIGGFGIHSDTVSYYTGGHHRWYKTTSQTSSDQVMQLDASGNLSVTGTFSASGYNSSNWNTAYSWGNHASAGYLTSYSETDTLASVTGRGASTTSAITVRGITATKDTSQITINRVDGGGATWQFYSWPGGLNIFPNSQLPIFIGRDGSVTDFSLWNGKLLFENKNAIEGNADSWLRLNQSGDYGSGVYTPGLMRADGGFQVSGSTVWHSSNLTNLNQLTNGPGYITSYTETDPIYVSERDSLRLNKTVHSTLLFSTLADYNKPSGYSTMIQPGSYQTPLPSHGYYHIIARRDTAGGYGALLQSYNSHELYHGNTTDSSINISWYKIWNSGDFTSTNVSNWNTAYGWGNHASAGYATTSYVTTQINNLIAGAPGALDTLDELAAALGDDSNFATTVTNSIAGKVSKSGDTMTGNLTTTGLIVGNGVATGRQPYGPLANANIVLTSSASNSSGVCGIEFYSGNNYPSDGASIYFENNTAGGGSERAKLTIRVENDQEDHVEIRAGKVVLNANTYSGGGQDPSIIFQHNDSAIASISSNGQVNASGGNSSQWNSAYGWGNHASAGYALNSALANYLPLSGGSIGGALTVNGNLTVNGTITENSSIKLKENVETSEGNLEKVVNLRPVTYNKIGSQTTELGLIAEEVAEVYPEFVQYDENGEPIGVHYSRLTAALIGAVKELTNQVQELNKKING
jgi:hypothetical protein